MLVVGQCEGHLKNVSVKRYPCSVDIHAVQMSNHNGGRHARGQGYRLRACGWSYDDNKHGLVAAHTLVTVKGVFRLAALVLPNLTIRTLHSPHTNPGRWHSCTRSGHEGTGNGQPRRRALS